MELKKRVVINLFLIVFLMAFISANFEIGDLSYSIDTTYGPASSIRGWINISFDNEKTNSIFEDSLGNSISLVNLINKNNDFEHTCSAVDCISDYSPSNGEVTKSFSLNNRENKNFGFVFQGEISSIDSLEFIIESDATSSCYNQIELDFLNDGIIDKGNDQVFDDSCSFLKNYGCFNESKTIQEPSISSIPYCQRVTLFESPGFNLGAWILEETEGDKKLTMALYDLEGDLKESCELVLEGISSGAEVSCSVDYLVTKSLDFYVCIYSDEGTGVYRTQGYSSEPNCGFYGFPTKTETNIYKIFAEGRAFAAVGTLNISNSISDGSTLAGKVSNYIQETYGSLDCENTCVVPINIISGQDQQVSIKNLKIVYAKPGLVGITENKFYDLEEIPATVSSDFQKLYLDNAEFIVPDEYQNINFQLELNNEEIFSQELSIEEIPLVSSISPKITASAFPTLFKVTVNANSQITRYNWDFGDDSVESTSINEVMHTYSSSGKYTLKLNVIDSIGRSVSKEFEISVVSPTEVINDTIEKNLLNLKNIRFQITKFDDFSQKGINSILDVSIFEDELERIEKEYNLAFFEEEYNQLLKDLLELNIPESILATKNANSILVYPMENHIDLYILETIGGGSYNIEDENKYINAVLFWNQKNIDTKITFKEISARYNSLDEPLLNVFELEISEKEVFDSNPYFILKNIENLEFKEDYLQNEESGYAYIELTKGEKIVFSTTEDVDFTNLPFFISPAINRLSISEVISVQEEEFFSKWVLFILIIFFLGIIGVIVYIILQVWYKNKYETYLFKNKNHLYNLITYIQGSRKKGLKDSEISRRLKKAGWKSEQVNYVLKKHSGKRTGMFEIPVGKVINKFKKKDKKISNKNRFQNTRNKFIR